MKYGSISYQRKRKISDLSKSLEESESKRKASEHSVKKAKVGREDTVSLILGHCIISQIT